MFIHSNTHSNIHPNISFSFSFSFSSHLILILQQATLCNKFLSLLLRTRRSTKSHTSSPIPSIFILTSTSTSTPCALPPYPNLLPSSILSTTISTPRFLTQDQTTTDHFEKETKNCETQNPMNSTQCIKDRIRRGTSGYSRSQRFGRNQREEKARADIRTTKMTKMANRQRERKKKKGEEKSRRGCIRHGAFFIFSFP
jgi:hypothetical protein